MRINLDNSIYYYSCKSPEQKVSSRRSHSCNSVYSAHFITRRKI